MVNNRRAEEQPSCRLWVTMYLATVIKHNTLQYIIRQSFFDSESETYKHRDIFLLGPYPRDSIILFDERIFYFIEELEEAVGKWIDTDPTLLLEELLWEFLPKNIRERLPSSRGGHKTYNRPLLESEKEAIKKEIHLFDRRRLYFLRYNAIDQRHLWKMHEKLCRPLLDQCRDEREFYFNEQEKVLLPGEYKSYIYAIFNLQAHFHEYFSSFMPEALDHEKIADHLEKDICTLNSDKSFWGHSLTGSTLHPHLRRYLIMFFDFSFNQRSFNDDFVRNFQNSHRFFRWPSKNKVEDDQVSEIFDEKLGTLKKMNKKELTRFFRKRAKTLHPDQGGNHEDFILLCNAYDQLLSQITPTTI